ncbi:MAG: MFS transporter [Eggerthellaceae bacterium]|nr:MFS transporter [Eggerthellaceae bacterium]
MLSLQTMTRGAREKERLWSPIFVTIIAAMLFAFMVGQGVNAGTTVYLERTGGSIALAGIGAMTFSVAAGVMRLVCGPVIDGRGRRIVMVAGGVIMLIGTVGPLFANTGAAFVIWRALQGMGFSAATTAANTAAADVLPFSRLGEGIGYAGLGQAIAMSVGPALAIFLVSTNPPENFYFGLIACAALSLALSILCRYEKDPRRLPETSEYRVRWEAGRTGKGAGNSADAVAAKAGALRRIVDATFEPTALRGTIVILVMATVFSFNVFFMGSFGNSMSVANSGIYYTVMAVMMIVVRLGAGRFMDKVRPIVLMGVACACGICAFALGLGCVSGAFGTLTEPAFYCMGIPFGVCIGLGIPVNQTVAVKMTPPERWGAANGLFMLGIDLSNAVASALWGFLIQSAGYGAALIGCICALVLSFVVAAFAYPRE